MAYSVVPDEDGAACIRCDGSETGTIYPEEVSAHVINKLVEATTEYTGILVDRAVISVPAYFNEDQQEATLAAGVLALCARWTVLSSCINYLGIAECGHENQ